METTGNTPKYKVLNRDAVKYLAILLMFIGHAVAWWYLVREPGTDTTSLPFFEQALMQIGVFCPPVMFFMIADGYKYTRDRRKYALRLLSLRSSRSHLTGSSFSR